jgi:hypothetical protein
VTPTRTLAAAVVLASLAALTHRSLVAPAVPAARAQELLATHAALFPDAPHPTGSDAAAATRDRIAEALSAAGCAPHRQRGWSCGKRACALVENVWCATGPQEGDALVGMAHTDSVAAGPGAADDAAGVVAWVDALRHLDPADLRRPLVLVLTDAEEPGLLGARAWFADPPYPGPIGHVVNLEARGTTGAAFLFQTVGPTAPWGTWAASSTWEPRASSLYPTVYGWIPNDTDLTVVARRGIPGVNHAFLGALPHYHTPLDDRAHLDPRSLAHEADLAAGWIATLQRPPEAAPTVFTDVFGRTLLRWPRAWTWPLVAGCGLAALGWSARDLRSGVVTGRSLVLSAGAALGATAATVALAEGAGAVVAWTGSAGWFWPQGVGAAVAALACAAWSPVGAVATPEARWNVATLTSAALAALLTSADVGLSVLGLPFVAGAVLLRLVPGVVGLGGGLLGAGIAWLPLVMGLPDVLGVRHPATFAVPLAMVLLGASPFAPARPLRVAGGALAVAIALLGGVVVAPPNPERPLPVNVVWDDTAGTRSRLSERTQTTEARAVPPKGLPPPMLTWERPGALRVVPARGGRIEVTSPVPYTAEGAAGPAEVTDWWGVPREGLVFRFAGPMDGVRIREITVGLPDGELPDRAPWEAPAHKGDRTIVAGVMPPTP